MKKLLILLFIFSSVSIFAQKVIINGDVSDKTYEKVQILNAMTGDLVNEQPIEKNKFKFEFEIQNEDVYALYFDENTYYLMDLKPGEKIDANIVYNDLKKSKFKGSDGTEFYFENFKKMSDMTDQEKTTFIDSLVKANPGKLMSIVFAYYLDVEAYSETHLSLLNSLSLYKDNKLYKDYEATLNVLKLAIGSVPPEIVLPGTDGKDIALSSTKGKYVLIDFWASWCSPCRGESPYLVAAYNKFSGKGFTIYSVSLDNDKNKWIKAINDDKLSQWIHVSDLKGWASSAGQAYGISSIPANFLLDPSGKIIAKNLRGEALDKKLEELLNK